MSSPDSSISSTRHTLTTALAFAKRAVSLEGQDPQGAALAYSQSITLISEVMERVAHSYTSEGVSEVKRLRQVDEVRRLRSIRDAYVDKVKILSDSLP